MINNYREPGNTIEQSLEALPDAITRRMYALIIGPQFHLSRYGSETVPGFAYDSDGTTLPFTGSESNYVPDADSIKVFAENLDLSLTTFAGPHNLASFSKTDVVSLKDLAVVKGAGLAASFAGREVQVGDTVITTKNEKTLRRQVTGLVGKDQSATLGSSSAKDDGFWADSDGNPSDHDASQETVSAPEGFTIGDASADYFPTEKGPTLNGKFGDQYTITVTESGVNGAAKVRIRTRSGFYSDDNVVVGGNGTTTFTVTSQALQLLSPAVLTLTTVPGNYALVAGQKFVFNIFSIYRRANVGSNKGLLLTSSDTTYTGPSDTTYIVKVIEGTPLADLDPSEEPVVDGAVVQITDASGVDVTQTYTVLDNVELTAGTFGVKFKFLAAGMRDVLNTGDFTAGLKAGDVYFIHAVAASQSTEIFDKIVLNGPAVDLSGLSSSDLTIDSLEFRKTFNGEIKLQYDIDLTPSWTVGSIDEGVTIRPSLRLLVPERTSNQWVPFVSAVDDVNSNGQLFLSYRAVVPSVLGAQGPIAISTNKDAEQLGPLDPDNDLAFGVWAARQGSQGRTVYALRTGGIAAEDFQESLRIAENSDLLYALSVLTDSDEVRSSLSNHVSSMSEKDIKQWRRAYVGIDSPGVYPILQTKSSGANYQATITPHTGDNNVKLRSEDVNFLEWPISRGDLVRINFSLDAWGNPSYGEFKVDRILNEREIILQTGPSSPITPAQKFELWKADTASSQADFVVGKANASNNRRIINVWSESQRLAWQGSVINISSKYLAAEAAGLRGSQLPQQGLTRTTLSVASSAPAMFTKYDRNTLNRIAASGTFIITQDMEGGPLYIRHQLTTKTDQGSLFYEDSAGTIVDAISYEIKDFIEPFVGKKNANAGTLNEIRRGITTLLESRTVSTLAESDIGPMLVDFEIVDLRPHPVLKDRFTGEVRVDIALPLNGIDLTIGGESATIEF